MDFDQFDICNKVTDYDLIFSDSVDMIAPVTNMLAFENYLLLKHRNGEYCFSVIFRTCTNPLDGLFFLMLSTIESAIVLFCAILQYMDS